MKAIRVAAQVTLSDIRSHPRVTPAKPNRLPLANGRASTAWSLRQYFPTGTDVISTGIGTGERLAAGQQTSGDRAGLSFQSFLSGDQGHNQGAVKIAHTDGDGMAAIGVEPLRLIANRDI